MLATKPWTRIRGPGPSFKRQNESGAELDLAAEHVWEVRDGQITRFENKVDRDAWAQAWS
jgi:ketosteroid isomerase-like protein